MLAGGGMTASVKPSDWKRYPLETLPSSRRRKTAFTGSARMPAGGGMTGKCQAIGLETLPFGNATLVAPAKAGSHWKCLDAGMTGKCQTIGLETLPFGNAALVAPAKAGIYWKCPDAGWRRNDGKCQTIGLETLPSLRRRKPAATGNAWMPAGGGMTAGVKPSDWKRCRRRRPACRGDGVGGIKGAQGCVAVDDVLLTMFLLTALRWC